MAYLPTQEEVQEQGQQNQQQGNGIGQQGQPTPAQSVQSLGGQSSALGSGQNVQRAQTDSPTGFTNINRYLDQNKLQGQQMADTVTSNVLDTADTAASTIRDTGEVFNKNVESQRVDFDPSQYLQDVQPFNTQTDNTQPDNTQTDNTQQSQQTQQTPQFNDYGNALLEQSVGVNTEQERLDNFLKQRDAQYKGLGSIEEDYDSFNTMRTSLNEAQNEANMLRTDDRGTLAARLNPEYSTTSGMSALDNMMFADKSKQDQIYNTLNQIEGMNLQGTYDDVVTDSKAIADQVRAANLATRENTGQLLDTTRDIYGNTVNQNVTDAISNAQGIMSGIEEKIRTNQRLTQDEVNRLGITMDDYNQALNSVSGVTALYNSAKNTARNWDKEISKKKPSGSSNAFAYMSDLEGNVKGAHSTAKTIVGSSFDPDILSAYNYVDPSLYINATNAADPELYARQQALSNLANNDEGFNLIGDPTQSGSYLDQVLGTFDTDSIINQSNLAKSRMNNLMTTLNNYARQTYGLKGYNF